MGQLKGKTYTLPVGSAKVELISADDSILSERVGRGIEFEPQSRRLWAEWCAKGGMVLDVGAYTGLFAIGAVKLGCYAISFEPMPFNAERVAKNARLNGVEFVQMQAALSDRNGEIEITYNPKTPFFTSGASLVRKKGSKLTVKTLTIDSLKLPQVTAIKIDVERGEPFVLRGARETLARCRPMMLVEALGMDERNAVMDAVDDYDLVDVIDVRNLVLAPC